MERENEIKSSHASNSIEGNPLSLPEVSNLLLGDRLPVNKDEKEVYNYFNILKNLDGYVKSNFNLSTILKIHKSLLAGVNDKIAGQVRKKEIVVGKYIEEDGVIKLKVKHNPPIHKKEGIEKAIKDLTLWTEDENIPTVIKAGIFHHEFVYIHPFEDGNGRTCRLLTALLFQKENYGINKYFVLDDFYDIDRSSYSDSLHSADMGDKTKWLEYFSDGMKYSLQASLGKMKNALGSIKVTNRPTQREIDVIEIVKQYKEVNSNDVAKNLKVSRQQAHNLLKSLLEKGLIKKKGSTKGSYYFL